LEVLENRLAPATLIVNTAADETAADNFLSLREAIGVVDAGSTAGLSAAEIKQISGVLGNNDTIGFAGLLNGQTISLTQGSDLTISRNLSIKGLGATHLAISGNSTSGVFAISNGVTALVANLTIADGLALQGGGVDNAGSLTLGACILSNNQAVDNGSGLGIGGGIFNEPGANLAVINCLFSGNQANGGNVGLGYGGGMLNEGTATVLGSTFTSNQSTGGGKIIVNPPLPFEGDGYGSGGAISNQFAATLTVSNCNFTSNLVTNVLGINSNGGAIHNAFNSTLTVSNSSFTANQSVSIGGNADAGAVANYVATAFLSECTFSANQAMGLTGTLAQGGAVLSAADFIGESANLTITSSTFVGNQALGGPGPFDGFTSTGGFGGAVENLGPCTLTLSQSSFTANLAQGGTGSTGENGGPASGGALDQNVEGTTTVTNCSFTQNLALGGTGGVGGSGGEAWGGGVANIGNTYAPYGPSNLTLVNCLVTSNQAIGGTGGLGGNGGPATGGGLYDDGLGAFMVISSQLSNNQAVGGSGGQAGSGGDGTGGGIGTVPTYGSGSGSISIISSVLSGNDAMGGAGQGGGNGGNGFGGGIYVSSAQTVTVTISSITQNQANGGSGASNGSGIGGGVYNLGLFTYDVFTVIASNFASTSNDNIFP
jgi:hypothetical protein